MPDKSLDRSSAAAAQEIMERLCPDAEERAVVLRQLLASIDVADQVSPDAWSVTLKGNEFRLNVGPVVAFDFDGRAQVYVVPPLPEGIDEAGHWEVAEMNKAPPGAHRFVCTPSALSQVREALYPSHRAYIEIVARKADGQPHKTNYPESRSPGLVLYAKHVVGKSQT